MFDAENVYTDCFTPSTSLELIRDYGPAAVSQAMQRAYTARAFGADYIANILRQQQARREVQPPVRLRQPELNELAPIRFRCWNTTLSFCNPERNP